MSDAATMFPVTAGSVRQLASMRGIVKAYGSNLVLDHIDLDVAPMEKVALIGPSGSGKTTILRMMIGLTQPDEGTIEIDGEYLWHTRQPDGTLRPAGERHARKVRRALGMVFQQFNLFPHMTALENVREPIQQVLKLPKDEAEARAVAIMKEVGLGAHLQQRPSQLSGGQQQRVAIARALINDPAVLLADEPTGSLDFRTGEMIMGLLEDLHRSRSLTSIHVTHNLPFARRADRILKLDRGSLIETASSSDLL